MATFPLPDETPVFSEEELRAAMANAGMQPDDMEDFIRVMTVFAEDVDPASMTYTDETLLLLATVSDDAARRVLQLNPLLSDYVTRLRKHPEAIARILAEFQGRPG